MMFDDREQAGEKLSKALKEKEIKADIVLAIPRGGLPLGRKVADFLGTQLDVVVATKVGSPANPELGIGAVASDGTYWLNEELIDSLEIDNDYIENNIEEAAKKSLRKLVSIRGSDKLPELRGKNVVVVDDGVATGGTMMACLKQIRKAGAQKVIVAVPVAPVEISNKLAGAVDELIILEKPLSFGSVGEFYKDFSQLSDEEVRSYFY